MPIVGERLNKEKLNRSYSTDSMHGLAEQFLNIAKGALNETVDIFTEPHKFMLHESMRNDLKNFFIENSYDPSDPEFNDAEKINDFEESMAELFNNDAMAVTESAPLGAFNPVIGLSFPMHKNLLMTTVFDKGAIPKATAVSPKFTETLETRTLVDVDGNEIDMFYEQDKIHGAIKDSIPTRDVVLMLPEVETHDIVKENFGGLSGELSIRTSIVGVVMSATAKFANGDAVTSYVLAGERVFDATAPGSTTVKPYIPPMTKIATADVEAQTAPIIMFGKPIEFRSSYGEYDRSVVEKIKIRPYVKNPDDGTRISDPNPEHEITATISAYVKNNKLMVMCTDPNVAAVIVNAVIDVSSAAYDEPYTKWSARTDIFNIPEAPHIATNVSPEEVKDINALYQVNQLTKIMSMMNLSLANYKDDEIRLFLNKSFLGLAPSQKVSGAFDFVPPNNFLGNPIDWRRDTFMDQLDIYVTQMLQVLNDENMTVTVFGRPDLIRRLTPTSYTYSSPSNIGPVELDYKKTIVTSDKRVYQFISSNKLRNNNNLILILCPRNTNRIIYKIYDYQFYVSNEIRTTKGYQLPAVTAFERWLMIEYQPVQGRIEIVNPTGLREVLDNSDPIGTTAMNDYTANRNTWASEVNGAATKPVSSGK